MLIRSKSGRVKLSKKRAEKETISAGKFGSVSAVVLEDQKSVEPVWSRVLFRVLAAIVSLFFSFGTWVVLSSELKNHQPLSRILVVLILLAVIPGFYAVLGQTGGASIDRQNLDGSISSKRFWITVILMIAFCALIAVLLILKSY